MTDPIAYDGDWIECWKCAGEGSWPDCQDEIGCAHPEDGCDLCMVRCDICRGKGGWRYDEEDNRP